LTRKQKIDRIVTASIWGNYEGRRLKPGEKSVHADELGKQMAALHLSPTEMEYIKNASASRGQKATERVNAADRHRFIHEDLPYLAHAADVGITGGLVGDISHGRALSAGINAALLFPGFRVGRGILAGARAARAGAELGHAVEAGRSAYEARGLVHNALVAQLPKARSRITRVGENIADKTSIALETNPRFAGIKDKWYVRHMTAGDRVMKAVGRQQRIDTARRYAALRDQFNAIHGIKKGSDEDIANFWYAQLPSEYRNVEGLQRVRDMQASELQRITSGEARKSVEGQIAAVKAQMKGLKTMEEKAPLMAESDELKRLLVDLPARETDLGASLHTFDRLLADPPAVNQAAIDAAHVLSRDRERILIDAGRLDPEQAVERRRLVSRWLGIGKPLDEEAPREMRLGGEGESGFFNQTGQYFDSPLINETNQKQSLVHRTLHDADGSPIGSIVYEAKPNAKKLYVESIYVKPEYRGSIEALNKLVKPLIDDGRPIRATFENARLARLVEKLAKRGDEGARGLAATVQGKVPAENLTAEAAAKATSDERILRMYGKGEAGISEEVGDVEGWPSFVERNADGEPQAALSFPHLGDDPFLDITIHPGVRGRARSQVANRLFGAAEDAGVDIASAVHPSDLSEEESRLVGKYLNRKETPEPAAAEDVSVDRGSQDPVFIGHRLPDPTGYTGSFMPSGGKGLGRVRSPKGVGSKNKLVLASTGRLRQSLHIAAEDRHAAQAFEQANIDRANLAAGGTAFDPLRPHIPEDHALVNPKGLTVPAHWKSHELAQFSDTYDDIDKVRDQAQQLVEGFYAGNAKEQKAMIEAARNAGVKLEDLRVIPKRHVDRYYSQFKHVRPRGKAAKELDKVASAVATSIVFARIGYVPKNIVQNLVMMLPHQGAFFLNNTIRAAQAVADPELRHLLQTEVGHTGAFGSLTEEGIKKLPGRASNKLKEVMGKVADDPLRMSAFMHEAAAEGVISKVSPILNERDRASLIKLLTDPSERARLNDIRQRSVDAMADFTRLNPDQMRIARRLAVIPSWLVAGTRYPFHFAATHPIRSALMAYAAMGEPGAPDELHFNQPVTHYFHGSGYLQGIDTPWGRLRTSSLSPVSTPWDLAQAAVQTVKGKQPFDFQHETAFDFAEPGLATGVRIAQGEGLGSVKRLVPSYTLARDLISPHTKASFPGDKTRTGRILRETGVVPIPVTDPEPTKGPMSPHDEAVDLLARGSRAFGGEAPPEYLVKSAMSKADYQDLEKKAKDQLAVTKLDDRQRALLKASILIEWQPQWAKEHDALMHAIKTAGVDRLDEIDNWIERQLLWSTDLSQMSEAVNDWEKHHPKKSEADATVTPGIDRLVQGAATGREAEMPELSP